MLSVRIAEPNTSELLKPLHEIFPKASTSSIVLESMKLLLLLSSEVGVRVIHDDREYALADLINMKLLTGKVPGEARGRKKEKEFSNVELKHKPRAVIHSMNNRSWFTEVPPQYFL